MLYCCCRLIRTRVASTVQLHQLGRREEECCEGEEGGGGGHTNRRDSNQKGLASLFGINPEVVAVIHNAAENGIL